MPTNPAGGVIIQIYNILNIYKYAQMFKYTGKKHESQTFPFAGVIGFNIGMKITFD